MRRTTTRFELDVPIHGFTLPQYTANRVLTTVQNGYVAPSTVSNFELENVDGTTGAIQTNLDAKQSKAHTIVTKTTTYTIGTADDIILANGTFTITLPDVASYTGRIFTIKNIGTGTITVAGGIHPVTYTIYPTVTPTYNIFGDYDGGALNPQSMAIDWTGIPATLLSANLIGNSYQYVYTSGITYRLGSTSGGQEIKVDTVFPSTHPYTNLTAVPYIEQITIPITNLVTLRATTPMYLGIAAYRTFYSLSDYSTGKAWKLQVTAGSATQTIDGDTTVTMPIQYTAIQVVSDGSSWHII